MLTLFIAVRTILYSSIVGLSAKLAPFGSSRLLPGYLPHPHKQKHCPAAVVARALDDHCHAVERADRPL